MSEEFEAKGTGHLVSSSPATKVTYRGLTGVPRCSRLEVRERLAGFSVDTVDFEKVGGLNWIERERQTEATFQDKKSAEKYMSKWMGNYLKADGIFRGQALSAHTPWVVPRMKIKAAAHKMTR